MGGLQKCLCCTVIAVVFLAVVSGLYYWLHYNSNPCESANMTAVTDPTTGGEICVCKRKSEKDSPMIFYHGSEGKGGECYSLHTQGPCQEGHWLAWSKDGSHIVCRNNSCLHLNTNRTDLSNAEPIVLWKGNCHFLGEACSSNTTDNGLILYELSGSGRTTCMSSTAVSNSAAAPSCGGVCRSQVRWHCACVEYTGFLEDDYENY